MSVSDTQSEPKRSVLFRLALAINFIMVIAVGGFVLFDYFREIDQRLVARQAGLRREAMFIHQGVRQIRMNPTADLQEYIDQICAGISDEEAPDHHIAVEIGGQIIQSRAHHRDSPTGWEELRNAAVTSSHDHFGKSMLASRYAEDGVSVYVGERMTNLSSQVLRQAALRSLGAIALGLVIIVSLNVVVRRMVARPLRRLIRTIDAIGSGTYSLQSEPFSTKEMYRLAQALGEMSRALAENDARRRHTMDEARRIQENLFPRESGYPGMALAAVHRAAEDVAGDYYDVLSLKDGSFLIVIADVVGHGIPAALIAAMLKVLLLEGADFLLSPGDLIHRVNERFTSVCPPEFFASLFVARWMPTTRTLEFANAGHEPPLLRSCEGPCVALPGTGMLVGLAKLQDWEINSVKVDAGAMLVCFSDGVTEAMSSAGETYGRSRLLNILTESGRYTPGAIVQALDLSVQVHLDGKPATDDYTLFAVQFE